MPYCAEDCCACIRFSSPTGRVFCPVALLMSVMEMMYSFQKERKLNRMIVMMEGCAIGKMMRSMVVP